MTNTPRKPEPEYGPLGPGHAPEKDPLKGFRGVASGTLVMEAITMGLVLTVIGRIDSGAYWTAGNATFVIAVAVVHLVLAFLQRFSWGLPAASCFKSFPWVDSLSTLQWESLRLSSAQSGGT